MERLLELLRNANLPVQYLTGSSKANVGIAWAHDPTEEQKSLAQSLIDSFDDSLEAEQAWQASKKKTEAIQLIDSLESPVVLLRNAQKIVLLAFTGVIGKLNEVITSHNEKTGANIELYDSPKSWEELVEQLKFLITIE